LSVEEIIIIEKRESMMISIGYDNFVRTNTIVSILPLKSARTARLKRGAHEQGRLINASSGRRVKSIIVLKSNHIVLSALGPDKLKMRLGKVALK
jgi:regulator of extracellular matrix RemA (YlzA/DUF370 family)